MCIERRTPPSCLSSHQTYYRQPSRQPCFMQKNTHSFTQCVRNIPIYHNLQLRGCNRNRIGFSLQGVRTNTSLSMISQNYIWRRLVSCRIVGHPHKFFTHLNSLLLHLSKDSEWCPSAENTCIQVFEGSSYLLLMAKSERKSFCYVPDNKNHNFIGCFI